MTNEEWRSKTDAWRRGWRYGQGDVFILKEDSTEFIAGYRYAIEHPEGSCYTTNATTGK